MGVEVKQTLERDYDLVLTMREIRQLSVKALRGIGQGMGGGDAPAAVPTASQEAPVWQRHERGHIMPKEVVVQINTGQPTLKPLFIVHPIEG